MRKQFLFILLICLPFLTTAQIFVPDDNFEQALIDLGYDSGPLDNFVPFANIASVTSLDVSAKGISDLTGINGFPSLTTLYCNDNQLSAINLSNNMQLVDLRCDNNNLLFVNLSNLTQLEIFSAINNQLSSLNVSFNPALRAIAVSQNNLTSLDTSSNPFLVQILCDDNQLTSLTIDTFSDLVELYCRNNQLTTLDLTTNGSVQTVWCNGNQLTSINTNGLDDLITLVANENQLSTIDLSTNIRLRALALSGNNLTSIDVSNSSNLRELYLSRNQLSILDVTSNPDLVEFWCNNNQLISINTAGLTNLQTYVAYTNQLSTIDVNTNTALEILSIGNNNLSNINLTNNPSINQLYLSSNQFTALDVTSNPLLEIFWCNENQLTSLNTTGLTNLQTMVAYTNQLNALDVSTNTALDFLSIGFNNFTTVDVSNNTLLTELYTQSNELSALNLSANTALEVLWCFDNQLTTLDVSNNPNLTNLDIGTNNYTTLDVSTNTQLTQVAATFCPNLTEFNMKNGNNTIITDFIVRDNPNLECIEVDDPAYSTANWTEIDTGTTFSDDCNYGFTYVPNDNFEQALIDLGYDTAPLDDFVPTSNINTITDLNISSQGITDLTGIEDFAALQTISMSQNQITTIDFTSNSNLTHIYGTYGDLVSLNLTGLTNLQEVYVEFNDLTSLDVSTNTALDKLFCNTNNITSLNVANSSLTNLVCSGNDLTSLDVSETPALRILQANGNQLPTIDVSANSALFFLNLIGNPIEYIDLSDNALLETLYLNFGVSNQTTLEALDLSNNPALKALYARNMINLRTLNLKNNNNTNITTFLVSNTPSLSCIEVDDPAYSTANWTAVDAQVSFNTDCNYPEYTFVPDDAFEQALIDLGYDSGPLNNYVLTDNINTVTVLDVRRKGIQDLTGIHDFTALETLNCSNNALTSLDIRPNANLEVLNCSFNAISSIDVTNNYALRSLTLWNNDFTELDVSNNTALEYLDVDENYLTYLDVSLNLQLSRLYSVLNDLESLNVKNGNNASFTTFAAYGNPNLTCIQVDNAEYSTANWTAVDNQTSYSENCNYGLTYVPDENFEQALINLGYDSILDNYVSTAVIEVITTLDISNLGILDVTGIEDFSALEILNCSGNSLAVLDIRNNVNLTNLNCASNALTSLNTFNATHLTQLDASGNMLTELNLLNNELIASITINDNNIEVLNVNLNLALNELNANNNALEILNVQNGNNMNFTGFSAIGNPNLTCIQVDNAVWSTINWTNIDNQTSFSQNCGYATYVPDDNFEQALIDLGYDVGPLDDFVPTANINTVTSLDISNEGIQDMTGIEAFTTLEDLDCSGNMFPSLNVSANTFLRILTCDFSEITNLNVSSSSLEELDCSANKLKSLELSNTPELREFKGDFNEFETIDFTANTKLVEVDVNSNRLQSLTVSTNNALLETLHCQINELATLDVSKLPALRSLRTQRNRLRTIDIRNNLALTEVDISSNFLSEIDVQANINLTNLTISGNQLTEIDLSNNTLLIGLSCGSNAIRELSLNNNLQLDNLRIASSILTTIDASMLSNLRYFDAYGSRELHTVNLQNGNNNNAYYFNTNLTPNLYCVLVDDAAYSTTNWTNVDTQLTFSETSCNYIELSAKVLLQGASLAPNTGEESLMRDDLRVNGLISETSPYADGATASVVVRSDDNGENSMVDWIWVELREVNNPTNVIAGQSAILQRDGDIVTTDDNLTTPLIFDGLPVDKYHVVIKHRNHLSVMSATSETLKQKTTIVDFSDATNEISYGSNAQTSFGMQPNKVAMWAGNVNGDTVIQYSGTNPDTPIILSTVLNDPGNFLNFPTYTVSDYISDDLNMDGSIQYSGTNPDTPVILQNVLAHPGNFLNFSTFQITEQLPENE